MLSVEHNHKSHKIPKFPKEKLYIIQKAPLTSWNMYIKQYNQLQNTNEQISLWICGETKKL